MPIHPEFPYPLYLVISKNDCKELNWLKVAEEAILGGVDIIQLREKDISYQNYLAKSIALKKLTDKYQIPLIINDSASISNEIDCWGVHVGLSDVQPIEIASQYGHKMHIGWSLEYLNQLNNEQIVATHHLGVSPIFKTPTKTNTVTPWGIQGIENLKEKTQKPLIAIGGMNRTNAKESFNAGANSIAVVSAICGSTDPRKEAQILKELLK